MKTFGQVITEARKKAGLTQKEVAEQLRREDGRTVLPPFLVGRLPDDLQDLDVSHEEVIAAFRTFREALEKTGDGRNHNGPAATLIKELP